MSGERIETAGEVREQIARVLMPTLDEWWCGDHVDHHQHDDDGGPLPCCAEARREQALAQADALASLLAEAEARGAVRALLSAADQLGENQMTREGDVKEWLIAQAECPLPCCPHDAMNGGHCSDCLDTGHAHARAEQVQR